MALVGVALSNGTARYAVLDKVDDIVEVRDFGSLTAETWDDALRSIREETGVRDVALVVEPPNLVIQETELKSVTTERERYRAVRLRAEEFGFKRNDDVRVRFDEDNRSYFGALECNVSTEIRKAVSGAKMRLVWLEHAAYAWARLLDDQYIALIDATDDERIYCIVVGDRRAELRVFPNDDKLVANLEETLIEAERTGFTLETLSTVALIDPHGIFAGRSRIGQSTLKPYWLSVAPSRTAWMLPLGAAYAAAGGEASRDLLRVNFAEPEPRRWQDIFEPFVAQLPQKEVTVVGVGIAMAVLALLGQWSQLHMLSSQEQTLHDQAQALSARAAAVQQEAKIVSSEAQALADRYQAEESGPLAARALTEWMARYPSGATLTTVSYSPDNGVSVRGNIRSPRDLELAYSAMGNASAQVQQDGTVFTIQDANAPSVSVSPSPAPPQGAALTQGAVGAPAATTTVPPVGGPPAAQSGGQP